MGGWVGGGSTCGGGRIAFAQPLRQLGHLAANGFVTAHQSVLRDGVVLRSAEGPVVVLLVGGGVGEERKEGTRMMSGGEEPERLSLQPIRAAEVKGGRRAKPPGCHGGIM